MSGESLVFVSNRTTSSGHRYADIEGVQYEYPRTYRNQISPAAASSTTEAGKERPHATGWL